MFALSIIWILLAIAVGTLAVIRRFATRGGDSCLHVSDGEAPFIAQQIVTAHRLEKIDQWGKALTVAAAAYGFLLLVAFSYLAWQNSQQLLK